MDSHKLLGAVTVLLVVQACGGGDHGSASLSATWSMFRQNLRHTGLSTYQTTNNTGSLKWSFITADQVQSSPALGTDGTIYVGSTDHKLYAIDPYGKQKWSFTTGSAVKSSPAIANGTIYVGSDDHKLYAISTDGREKWSFSTGSFIAFSSPMVGADGTIYVGSEDSKLYAINPDGKPEMGVRDGWRYRILARSRRDGNHLRRLA